MARAQERNGGRPKRWVDRLANSQRFEPKGIVTRALMHVLRRWRICADPPVQVGGVYPIFPILDKKDRRGVLNLAAFVS